MAENKKSMEPVINTNTISGVAFILLGTLYKMWRANPINMEKMIVTFWKSEDAKKYILDNECKNQFKAIMPNFPINNTLLYQAVSYLEDLDIISKKQVITIGNKKSFDNFKITGNGINLIEGAQIDKKHKKSFLDKFNVNINFNIESIFNFSAINHII